MFGIKTKIIKFAKVNILFKFGKIKFANDFYIKQLMEYFRADEYGHQASSEDADLGYGWIHYGLLRQIKPQRVLCVGSRQGFIPAVLAQACKDNNKGHVDFVDPGYGLDDKNHWTGIAYWRTKKGKECFSKFGLKNWINLYIMTSSEFASKLKRKYDYIYIDGDHSYKGVSYDYKVFWPRLKNYGFMVFHDVNVIDKKPEGKYGIHKLWKEISNKYAFELPFKGSGLGVIQKVNARA